jgi:PAS domain S-box-containing protein
MKKLPVDALNNLFNFLEQQSDSILWIRSKGYRRQLYVSPNFESIFGYKAELLYQKPSYFEQMLYSEDQNTSREMIQLNECGQARTAYLYRVKLPQGELKYIKDWHYLLTDENDIILGVAGIAQVISKEQWMTELQMAAAY